MLACDAVERKDALLRAKGDAHAGLPKEDGVPDTFSADVEKDAFGPRPRTRRLADTLSSPS